MISLIITANQILMGKGNKGRGDPMTPPHTVTVYTLKGNDRPSDAIVLDDNPDHITHLTLSQAPKHIQLWLKKSPTSEMLMREDKDTFKDGKPRGVELFFLHNGTKPTFSFERIHRTGKRRLKCTRVIISL